MIRPAEILREEYVLPVGLSANRLAIELPVPVTRVRKILNEEREVYPDTAVRLARYLGEGAQAWLNLQAACELKRAISWHGADI